MAPRRRGRADPRRQIDQRPLQDVGEDQIEGLQRDQFGMVQPHRLDAADPADQIVHRDIGLGHLDRHRIDVAGQHRDRPDPRRRHRQNGGAAADIGDPRRGQPRRRQPVQRPQAALGGAVMPGAEGHRRLDQKADPVRGQPVGIMAAIDEEPPGLDRREFPAHLRHPVGLGQFRDHEGLGAMGRRQQRQRDPVGRRLEIAADLPQGRAVLQLEHADARGRRVHLLHGEAQSLGGVLARKGGQRGPACHLGLRLRPRPAIPQGRAKRKPRPAAPPGVPPPRRQG